MPVTVGSHAARAALALFSAARRAATADVTVGVLAELHSHEASGASSCKSSWGNEADGSGSTPLKVERLREFVVTPSAADATSCSAHATSAKARCTSSSEGVPL